jgi:phosphoribosylglycinamide formyltransferase-1
VVVLASGRGTNLQALIDAGRDPEFPAEVVAVIANRPGALALKRAREAGIAHRLIDHRQYPNRPQHEAAVAAAIDAERPDIVCLAGYMRILSAAFVGRYRGRMINIHPSLLPLFPGLHTHDRVLAAGMKIHGATVHFVTEGVDAGPIIAQAAVPVLAGDDAETLAARVLAAENRLYPLALALVADGAAQIDMVGAGGSGAGVRGSAADAARVLYSPPLPQ